MNNYVIHHPWKLIGYKMFYFPILHIIYRLPIPYEDKLKYKKKFFYDNFAKFSRNNLRANSAEEKDGTAEVYDLGLFKICILSNSQYFSLTNLEWNLAYEFFDIVYPALNKNYFKFILGEGPYESKDVFIEKGDYVVDAGANLGIFSFLASTKVGDRGRVYSIEPIHFFIQCIEESQKINRFNNIFYLEVALGSENKEEVIFLDSNHPGNSGLNIKSSKSIPIIQSSLDSLVYEQKRIPRVDFLKMDIEGSERQALMGGREAIFEFKPKLSLCTYHLKDDPIVLRDIIKSVNPKYKIEMGKKKLYARI